MLNEGAKGLKANGAGVGPRTQNSALRGTAGSALNQSLEKSAMANLQMKLHAD